MRRAIFLTLLLPIASQAAQYTPTLTGDQFASLLLRRAKPLTASDVQDRDRAYSYLDGVRDSTEGRIWCDVNQYKTADMAYSLAAKIAKLPQTERMKNASLLLLELLQREYPCPSAGSKQ